MSSRAKKSVRLHLERLHASKEPISTLNYEEAIRRADLAASFVTHPYWETVSRMLSGTIQAETEQLLSSDEHMSVNRASVAMCRKILQMPYFDIEQGKVAESAYQTAVAKMDRKRKTQLAPNSATEGH